MSSETWDSDAKMMETLVAEYVEREFVDDETATEAGRLLRANRQREALELVITRTRNS